MMCNKRHQFWEQSTLKTCPFGFSGERETLSYCLVSYCTRDCAICQLIWQCTQGKLCILLNIGHSTLFTQGLCILDNIFIFSFKFRNEVVTNEDDTDTWWECFLHENKFRVFLSTQTHLPCMTPIPRCILYVDMQICLWSGYLS